MAYFSNGTEGDSYFATYCAKCHFDRNQDCPIWALHLTYNYEECNNRTSFLHVLIPRSKDGLSNEECRFFMPKTLDMFRDADQPPAPRCIACEDKPKPGNDPCAVCGAASTTADQPAAAPKIEHTRFCAFVLDGYPCSCGADGANRAASTTADQPGERHAD